MGLELEKKKAISKLKQLELGKKQKAVMDIIENIFKTHQRGLEVYEDIISDLRDDLYRVNEKEFNPKTQLEYSLFRFANAHYSKESKRVLKSKSLQPIDLYFNRLKDALWYAVTELSKVFPIFKDIQRDGKMIYLGKTVYPNKFEELYERYKKYRFSSQFK